MAELQDTVIEAGIATPEIRAPDNSVAINVDEIGSDGRYVRQQFIQRDLIHRTFSTTWALGPTFDPLGDFKANSLLHLYYLVPMRNDATGWGGAYIEPQIRVLKKNLVTNPNLDTGWSKTYATAIVFNEIPPPPGVTAQTVSFENADAASPLYWLSLIHI